MEINQLDLLDKFLKKYTKKDWYQSYEKRIEHIVDQNWINPKQLPFNVTTAFIKNNISAKNYTDSTVYKINSRGKKILPDIEVKNVRQYTWDENRTDENIRKYFILRRDNHTYRQNIYDKGERSITTDLNEIKIIAKECNDNGYIAIEVDEIDLSDDNDYSNYLQLGIIREI